ncbi:MULTISPECIES: hypothetical protein [Pseudoalteromonas]|uniref:hypothetical protein n=1 Tax=Pseudoalteromonas TaxID=53246 RepID=UPI0005F9D9D9|nr:MULTISPECIES: hypothetical protein [Pseudoalteromonas]MCG7537907.1 pyocin activator PrtN family protein [Pseudoalteromonas sp. OOF1S-7]
MHDNVDEDIERLAHALERDLYELYKTPMLSGEKLQMALGFSSLDAYRQALTRKKLPVPVFRLEDRHGYYALVKDVAAWLATQAVNARRDNIKRK